jgi:transcription antitermination factor NusG
VSSFSNDPNGLPWFAIQTRPRWEKFVHDALLGKGYESFLPVYKSRRRWSDRIKELELPLFSGYLFCRLAIEERMPVLTTLGVRQFVGIGRTPVSVPDSEIDAVRAIAASGLAAQPWPFLRVGHRVRLRGGSLDGVEGILVAARKRHRLIVSVELLQRSVAVEVDQAWVEAIAPSAPPRKSHYVTGRRRV